VQAQQRWQAGAHHGIGTGNLGGTRSRSGAEQGPEPAWDRDDREAHGGGGGTKPGVEKKGEMRRTPPLCCVLNWQHPPASWTGNRYL
jgi:hypothetical protein